MISYRLSSTDIILSVSGPWNDFALDNGGPLATEAHVVGRLLWSFVAGSQTRAHLERAFHGVRASGQPAALVYRCDGGGVERLFAMTIRPGPARSLATEHSLLRARPLAPRDPPTSLWARPARLCSLCGAASTGRGWLAPGRWHAAPRPLAPPSYVVCPDCRAAVARPLAATHPPRRA